MSYGTCNACGSDDCEGYDACTIRSLRAEVERLTRERDAYKKAKAENDERFMLERDAARAEVERLRGLLDQNETEAHRLIRWRREAEADAERLRGLLADAERHAQAKHRERDRDRQAIENERLREALRGLAESLAPYDELPGDEDAAQQVFDARDAARAALAGSPVETRREHDRALAERVRSHLIDYLNRSGYSFAGSLLRALDLDALLEGKS